MEQQHMSEQHDEQPVYNLPSMHITEGLLQQQIDPSAIIDEIENIMLGRKSEFDPETNMIRWSEPNKDTALINEQGMANLILQLRSRLTKIFQLSYFTEEMIEGMVRAFAKNIRESIFENWDDWNIKTCSDASAIVGILSDTFLATIQKAHQGKYLLYLGNVLKAEERSNMYPRGYNPMDQGGVNNNPNILRKLFGRG